MLFFLILQISFFIFNKNRSSSEEKTPIGLDTALVCFNNTTRTHVTMNPCSAALEISANHMRFSSMTTNLCSHFKVLQNNLENSPENKSLKIKLSIQSIPFKECFSFQSVGNTKTSREGLINVHFFVIIDSAAKQ